MVPPLVVVVILTFSRDASSIVLDCTQNESSLKTLMKKVQQMEEEAKRIDEDVIVER
jgi:hypothetical protein